MQPAELRKQIYDFLEEKGFDSKKHHEELKKFFIQLVDLGIEKGQKSSSQKNEPVQKEVENKFFTPKSFG